MTKKTIKVVCHDCGADCSNGFICDCHKAKFEAIKPPQDVINQLARGLLEATRRAFDDPTVVADFEKWNAEREKTKTLSVNDAISN